MFINRILYILKIVIWLEISPVNFEFSHLKLTLQSMLRNKKTKYFKTLCINEFIYIQLIFGAETNQYKYFEKSKRRINIPMYMYINYLINKCFKYFVFFFRNMLLNVSFPWCVQNVMQFSS